MWLRIQPYTEKERGRMSEAASATMHRCHSAGRPMPYDYRERGVRIEQVYIIINQPAGLVSTRRSLVVHPYHHSGETAAPSCNVPLVILGIIHPTMHGPEQYTRH